MPFQQKELPLLQGGKLDADNVLGALLSLLQSVGIGDRQGALQSKLAAHKDMPGKRPLLSRRDLVQCAFAKGLKLAKHASWACQTHPVVDRVTRHAKSCRAQRFTMIVKMHISVG